MPLPFRVGLIATVLVLAAVRMWKSLRFVRRSCGCGDTRSFRWGRWYHLVIVWALALFCIPFCGAIAFPDRAHAVSVAIDEWFAGGEPRPAEETPPASADVVSFAQDEMMKLEISHRDRTQQAEDEYTAWREAVASRKLAGWVSIGVGLFVVFGLVALASVLARLRKPVPTALVAAVDLLVSVAALAASGRVATQISRVPEEREAVARYASQTLVRSSDAAWLAGPSRIVGVPTEIVDAVPGYLVFVEPGQAPSDVGAPWAGFTLGKLIVGPAPHGEMIVFRPAARAAPDGHEAAIRDTDETVVMGYAAYGRIVPRPGYPIVIMPADARRATAALQRVLFGAAPKRALHTAMLQLLFATAAAWSIALVLAAACETLLGRFARPLPIVGGPLVSTKGPSITQILRDGNT
jgi:hypothetical protein